MIGLGREGVGGGGAFWVALKLDSLFIGARHSER